MSGNGLAGDFRSKPSQRRWTSHASDSRQSVTLMRSGLHLPVTGFSAGATLQQNAPRLVSAHGRVIWRLVAGQELAFEVPNAIFGAWLFGKPPAVLHMNDARIDSGRHLGLLPHTAASCLDPHPFSVRDSETRRRFRMDFRNGIALSLAKFFELAMLRVEKE